MRRLKYIHRFIFVAAALALTVLSAQAQDSTAWTLERCLGTAVQNSPRLAASRQTVAGAQAASQETAASRLPTLGVNGTYSYTNKVQKLSIPLSLPGFTPPNISFGDGNVYDLQAVVKAPIYAGGTLVESAKASRFGAQASRYDLATDSLSLLYNVRRAYYNALGAEARVDAAQTSAARLQRNLQTIIEGQKLGANSEENHIAALSRLRQAEEAVINSENQARAARLTLGSLVLEPGKEIIPAGDLNQPLVDSTAVSEVPLEARSEVASANARIEQSTHLTRASGGSLLPSLSGNAIYHYAKPGLDVTENKWMDYWSAGVTASWTLWDWNTRNYRIQQAHANRGALDERNQDLIASLQTRHQTALDALTAARQVKDKAAEHASLERQRLALVEGRLKLGAATETEYLDAQDDLAAAETDYASALAALRLAEADLLNASGY
jgi:outer membrane protein